MVPRNVRKVSVRKFGNLWPPRSHQLGFQAIDTLYYLCSGQVSLLRIVHISSIQEVLSLLFSLFLQLHADSFARGANLKLWQANAIGHKQKLLGCAGAWLCHCRIPQHTSSFQLLSMICKVLLTISYTAHTTNVGVAGPAWCKEQYSLWLK